MQAGLYLQSAALVAALIAGTGHFGQAAAAQGTEGCVSAAAAARDATEIRTVMAAYNEALNGGMAAAVLPLYTADGIFMAPYSQSAIGRSAIETAYSRVFHELKFNVKFTIAELVVTAPRWAYVRTNSAGTTLHHSTGKTTAEANQELFIFEKGDDGKWRIARYSFSPTNPPGS
jgi:uncharacterized protein (TIGR02246 family)